MNKRYCLALDNKNEQEAIESYDRYHQQVSPEIKKSIWDAGVINMEIYRTGNRLFMIMEVNADFSFEKKAAMDKANPHVQEWEKLMWNFFQTLPHKPHEKGWVLMDQIFALNE